MNKLYPLVLLSLYFIQVTKAQITINSGDILGWKGSGFILTEDTTNNFTINPGESGPNKIWDFTNLDLSEGIRFSNEFLEPSETPFFSEFPDANLAQRVSLPDLTTATFEAHIYANITSTEYVQLGGVTEISFPFDTTLIEFEPDTIRIFPLTYENSWTEVDVDSFDFGGIFLDITQDSTIYTVDAWGTVQLPIGNFECLRLREETFTISSSVVSGVSLPGDTTSYITYTWISDQYATVATMSSFDGETRLDFTQAESVGLLTSLSVEGGGGDTTQVDTPITAMVQIVHNAADPAANAVDIYVDINSDTIKLEDVLFRSATEFLELPAEEQIIITVAPGISLTIDEGLASFPITLEADQSYYVVANGVLDPGAFAANPEGLLTEFTLLTESGARLEAEDGESVDLNVLHGTTDAPEVGVNANGNELIPGFSYKEFAGYASVPAASYQLDIVPAGDTTVLASFTADLSSLGGGAALVIASGFLDSTMNQDGASFGLIAVLPDGNVLMLPAIVDSTISTVVKKIDGLSKISIYPNPASNVLNLEYNLEKPRNVAVTMFDLMGKAVLHLPTHFEPKGKVQHSWDVNNRQLLPGVYTLMIQLDDEAIVKRVMIGR